MAIPGKMQDNRLRASTGLSQSVAFERKIPPIQAFRSVRRHTPPSAACRHSVAFAGDGAIPPVGAPILVGDVARMFYWSVGPTFALTLQKVLSRMPKTTTSIAAACLSLAAPVLMPAAAQAFTQTGIGSYYGSELHGRRTASGERFNQSAMTAAHRTAPFGTRLKVTNLSNGRSVLVRVNDRGPFVRGRVVDISAGAARQIGMHGRGLARVRVERQ
jgi:rare lipoprotein A